MTRYEYSPFRPDIELRLVDAIQRFLMSDRYGYPHCVGNVRATPAVQNRAETVCLLLPAAIVLLMRCLASISLSR